MFKSFVSLLVAASFPVLAIAQMEETPSVETPSTESSESSGGVRAPIFVDRGYFLPRGQFNLSLSAGFMSSTTKTENALLVEREYIMTGSELKAGLSYGIINDLSVFLGTGYIPNQETENQTTLQKSKSKGMGESSVGVAYRFLNQSTTMPFDAVLGFVYSPKAAVSKSATTTDDGNAARGGDAKSVSLSFFRRVSTGEFGLRITHDMYGEQESEDATTGDLSKADASASTSASGTAQFEVSEKFYIMAGVGLAQIAERMSTEVGSGDVTTTEAYILPTFSGGLRIIAVPQKAFVDLGLSVATAQDIEVTSSTGINGKITSVAATVLTAGVSIEF